MSDSKVKPIPSANPELPVVGQRRLFYFNDQGQPAYKVFDLTVEDYINPQPGDTFFHDEHHDRNARILASMLRYHYRYSPTASVHVRSKVVWPNATLAQPMPDVVIVNNLSDSQRHRPVLDLAAEQITADDEAQVNVRAIFEMTSMLLADADLDAKRTLYERAQVQEYWIFDAGLRPGMEQPHFTVIGYQLQGDTYQPIPPISETRWESKACRIWIEVNADHESFQLGDLRTGKPFPMPTEEDDPSISAQSEADRRAQSIMGQLKL